MISKVKSAFPFTRYDTEEVLVFFDVKGEGFVRVGEEEYKVRKRAWWFLPEPFTALGCAAREP